MEKAYTLDGKDSGFYLQETVRQQWAVFDANGMIRTFKNKEAAQAWVYAKRHIRPKSLTKVEAARTILRHVVRLQEIWRLTPNSFPALHLFADVVNRLPVLETECRRISAEDIQ